MTVVLDANILIAYALSDEPLHTQATRILSAFNITQTPLTAPRLFRSEITAVIRKVVYQGRIPHEQGRQMLDQLLRFPLTFYEDDALLKSAFELAERFNRPRSYDTQYLALADHLSCAFWTADERLYNTVKDSLPDIHWLGDWSGEV
jgi:predicted nucleic acid-binding protein